MLTQTKSSQMATGANALIKFKDKISNDRNSYERDAKPIMPMTAIPYSHMY